MEDDGLPLPLYNWAIEPQGLGPNVMTARTLFSDTQPQLVARVLNNSLEDKLLSANAFLSMAEPVQCLSDDGYEPASLTFDGSSSKCDAMLFDETAPPVLSSLLSPQMSADGTELHASSVSATTVEATASDSSLPSSEGQQDHIESLLQRLPNNLTLNQKQRAEAFIRSRANVFSRSEFYIGRTNIIPHRIDMLEHDVIKPAASPWCSNVVMVRKQDGTMRLCKLNCLTVKDKFPCPRLTLA